MTSTFALIVFRLIFRFSHALAYIYLFLHALFTPTLS